MLEPARLRALSELRHRSASTSHSPRASPGGGTAASDIVSSMRPRRRHVERDLLVVLRRGQHDVGVERRLRHAVVHRHDLRELRPQVLEQHALPAARTPQRVAADLEQHPRRLLGRRRSRPDSRRPKLDRLLPVLVEGALHRRVVPLRPVPALLEPRVPVPVEGGREHSARGSDHAPERAVGELGRERRILRAQRRDHRLEAVEELARACAPGLRLRHRRAVVPSNSEEHQPPTPVPFFPQFPVRPSSSSIARVIRSPWKYFATPAPRTMRVRPRATLRASMRIVSGCTSQTRAAASGVYCASSSRRTRASNGSTTTRSPEPSRTSSVPRELGLEIEP